MVKVALLIGISEYGSGLKSLPGALRDIEAMQQVLQPSEKAGFDEVSCLSNPNPPVMREAMEKFFSSRVKNDLLLLFFSGYIVQDNHDKLYFATSVTCKTPRTELIRVSAIPVSFVQDLITNSECQQVVIILDCCLSDVSVEEISQNKENLWNIQDELGGENRVILAYFTSSHTSLEPEELNHSVYSRYLIEGMETGIADLDSDGWIAVDELHQYASNKVQIITPALKPEIYYPIESQDKILLLSVLTDDLKLKYRKEVENWLNRGEISQASRYILNKLSATLSLSSEACTQIEADILKPFQEYQKKLQRYRGEYALTIANEYPINTKNREQLKSFQQSLGLKNEDIAPIEEKMALKLTNILASKDDIEQLVQEGESHFNSVPLTLEVTEEYPPRLEASENHVDELVSGSHSVVKLTPLPPRIVMPEDNLVPEVTNLESSNTTNITTSTTPYKIFLSLGFGGFLAAIATLIILQNRPPAVSPSVAPIKEITTSTKPLPSPSVLPEKRVCKVFINGNLRSEPAYFLDNVVESLREPLLVTGKQTQGGWVEVTMPNNKLAWAYKDIISEQDRKEMGECLKNKEIKITIIEDILPPATIPSPQ